MAWRSSGKTNVELIRNLASNRIIASDAVTAAFRKVDRANYVLDKRDAYEDAPQSISYNVTISAPHIHGHATTMLEPFLKPGARVLDVGSGSGYSCAVFHHLVSPAGSDVRGKVIGIDHIPGLVEWSVENLRKDGLGEALDKGEIEMVVADGREGYPAGAPYDAIHVGAAAPTLPQALVDQLASPGRMFIPVGTALQDARQVDKDEHGNVTQERMFGVVFVPLTDPDTQMGGWR